MFSPIKLTHDEVNTWHAQNEYGSEVNCGSDVNCDPSEVRGWSSFDDPITISIGTNFRSKNLVIWFDNANINIKIVALIIRGMVHQVLAKIGWQI